MPITRMTNQCGGVPLVPDWDLCKVAWMRTPRDPTPAKPV